MRKVIIPVLLLLLVAGLSQAQDYTLEDMVEVQITEFKTIQPDMHIVFYNVVTQGQVIGRHWARWDPWGGQDLMGMADIDLQITDYHSITPDMQVVVYDVVAQEQVIGSHWACWNAERGYFTTSIG